MTQESKQFFKKYWQAILIFSSCQFLLTFAGSVSANKVRDYKVEQLEEFKTEITKDFAEFKENIEPRVNLLSWIHGIGTGTTKNPDTHTHN